jgi:hypothetical protein
MIISQFWLRVRWNNEYPVEEFEVMVTNLEAIALRFRFRFVATQVVSGQDCTQTLRDKIELLSNSQGTLTLLAKQDWSRDGHLYATRWDVEIGPGETHRTGLASTSTIDLPGMFSPDVLDPGGVLRGHWELSLPTLVAGTTITQSKPQLDKPARVLIAAFHRMHQGASGGGIVHDHPWTLPLASGKAEHFVPPDALLTGATRTIEAS